MVVTQKAVLWSTRPCHEGIGGITCKGAPRIMLRCVTSVKDMH